MICSYRMMEYHPIIPLNQLKLGERAIIIGWEGPQNLPGEGYAHFKYSSQIGQKLQMVARHPSASDGLRALADNPRVGLCTNPHCESGCYNYIMVRRIS